MHVRVLHHLRPLSACMRACHTTCEEPFFWDDENTFLTGASAGSSCDAATEGQLAEADGPLSSLTLRAMLAESTHYCHLVSTPKILNIFRKAPNQNPQEECLNTHKKIGAET